MYIYIKIQFLIIITILLTYINNIIIDFGGLVEVIKRLIGIK